MIFKTNLDRLFYIALVTALGMWTLYATGMLYFFFYLMGV